MDTQNKYRPQRIEDFVFATDRLERQIARYASGQSSRPLILHGKYGTGKSTLADLIPRAIDGPAVIVNKIKFECLNSNDEVRKLFTRSKQFDKFFTHGDQSRNYIVVEEVNFDPRAKGALRDSLDEMAGRDLAIFTTNEVAKIDQGLLSRAEVVEVPPVPPDRFLKHAQKVLRSEGLSIAETAILEVLESVYELHHDNRAYYKALDEVIDSWRNEPLKTLN